MTRDEISALLPFFANGTLEGDERAAVEAALEEGGALREELRALEAIRATLQAEETYSPGEMGLARLMREVEAETKAGGGGGTPGRPLLWQIAAALLLAIVVGQAVMTDRGEAPDGYQLAGAPEPVFVISVVPQTTEAELRALLLAAGVSIVNGPSALGLYELALDEGADEAASRATLEASALIDSLQGAGD